MPAARKMRVDDVTDDLWSSQGSSVHFVGVIVSLTTKETWQQGIIDDGTGAIEFRTFGAPKPIEVGQHVRLIGNPRTYGPDRYIAANVIKTIDNPSWVKLWKLETQGSAKKREAEQSPKEAVLEAIKTLDSGDGADVVQVIEKTGLPNAQDTIDLLRTNGDIFETRPGKLKVLE